MSVGNFPESLSSDAAMPREILLWRSSRKRFLSALWTAVASLTLIAAAISIWSHPRHHFGIVIAISAAAVSTMVFFALRASARRYELTSHCLNSYEDDAIVLERQLDDLLCVIVSFRGLRSCLGTTDIHIATSSGTTLLERVDNWKSAVEAIRIGLNERGCDLEPFHYTDSARMFVPTRGDGRRNDWMDDTSPELELLEQMWSISGAEPAAAPSRAYLIAPFLAIACALAGVVYSAVHHGDPPDGGGVRAATKLARTAIAPSAQAAQMAAPQLKPVVDATWNTASVAGAYNQHPASRCSSCHSTSMQTGTK